MDATAVVEVFDPGGDSGVDLVAYGEGTPVVVLGFECGPKGFGHGVLSAHLGLPHRHGSFHGAQVDPVLGAAQVGEIRDPHPVQATVIPLAGAVILMGHGTASAAPGQTRARVQACETLAAHRRGNRSRSSVTHRPTTDSPSPKSRATDVIVDPVSNTKDGASRRYSGVKRRREPTTGTSRSAGTRTRLTKCQQHQPKPTRCDGRARSTPPRGVSLVASLAFEELNRGRRTLPETCEATLHS